MAGGSNGDALLSPRLVVPVMVGLLLAAITGAIVVYREVGEIRSTLVQVIKNQEDGKAETIRFRSDVREDLNQIGQRMLYLERTRARPPNGGQQ